MRALVVLVLLGATLASARGLGIKTKDPKLQGFADLGADARYEAWKKLVVAGKPSVPTFVAMLNEKHFALRALGGSGLAQLGPLAKDAVPTLRAALADDATTDKVQLVCIGALGNIGPDAAAAVPALEARLASRRTVTVLTSAVALTKIDPGARGLPEAIAAVTAPRRMETPHALWMAQQLGSRAKVASKTVASVVRQSKNRWVRRAALRALATIDPGSDATRKLLTERLDDKELVVRVEAAALLTEQGVGNGRTRALLAEGLGASVAVTKVTAAAAMLRLEPLSVNALARMREALESATGKNQTATVEALYQIRRRGRAEASFADKVEAIAPKSVARVEGDAALTLWALTGDRERTLRIAKRALARGYFEGCADVVRLVRELETGE